MLRKVLATFIILIISGNTFASAREAHTLQSGCQDLVNAKDGYCGMYLDGYLDGLFAGTYLTIPSDFSITITTLRHLFLAHMASDPADSKKSAAFVLAKTLIENTGVSYNKEKN
jgi:hypothetical protein